MGEGSYGAVYKGTIADSNAHVAVKVTNSRNPTAWMLSGALIQASFSSQNILPLYGWFQIEGGKGALVTPIIPNGDLRNQVIDVQGEGQEIVNRAFQQILEGVFDLHARGVSHRDIKPDNILWDGSTAYIADFDTATTAESSTEYVVANGDAIGTPGYVSPEQMNLRTYTKAVDVFAVGMTWVRMNVNGMWEGKSFLKFWKAVVQPVSSDMYNTPQEIATILQQYPISTDMRNILAYVLCGPDRRIDINQFRSDWNNMIG